MQSKTQNLSLIGQKYTGSSLSKTRHMLCLGLLLGLVQVFVILNNGIKSSLLTLMV